jgi:hypothetical protein
MATKNNAVAERSNGEMIMGTLLCRYVPTIAAR